MEREVTVRFDRREVVYEFGELDEVSLAYAITIHKSQGSEFPAVVIPLATQHYLLLQRNLGLSPASRGANSWWCWWVSARRWQSRSETIRQRNGFQGCCGG